MPIFKTCLLLGCVPFALLAEERGMGARSVGTASDTQLNYHLLVIGIDDYLDWPDLKSAVRDAESVADVLQRNYSFDSSRTTALFNAEATERSILAVLREYAETLTESDALMIYYAGHGQLDPITQEGSWVPVDGERGNDSSWISNAKIKSYLRATKARHNLLVSDSCFAGDFFRGSRGAPPEITDAYVREAYGKNARQAITSGGVEPVADAGFDGHSVFAYFLLKALEENKSPYLVPSDLFQRIKGGVAGNAPQQPILGMLSGTGGEVGGEFVLFRKGVGGNLDDLIERKRQSLSLLEEQEAAAAETSAQQARLAAEKQKELDALDAKIASMQNRLNSGDSTGGSLSELVALIEQKEKQAAELAALEKKRREETAARQAEIARLKAADAAKREAAFEQDKADYEKIINSRYANEGLKQQAWRAFCLAWSVEGVDLNKPGSLRWDGRSQSAVAGFGGGADMEVSLSGGQTIRMVWIEPGSFQMGSPSNEANRASDESQHRVTLTQGYWLGSTEVTQGQWESVMGSTPSYFKGRDLPVEQVSWEEAMEFCRKLTERERAAGRLASGYAYTLPTEAQWEYACRAGTTGAYAGDLDAMGWNDGNSGSQTHAVGQKRANGWGLYDMHGNVWEWCLDWYGDYPSGSVVDPRGASSGSSRVYRGAARSGACVVKRPIFKSYANQNIYHPDDRRSVS